VICYRGGARKRGRTPRYELAQGIVGAARVKKKQREELIQKRAEELARSGQHEDWTSIEITLRHEGLREARQLLDSSFYRHELNEVSDSARQQHKKFG